MFIRKKNSLNIRVASFRFLYRSIMTTYLNLEFKNYLISLRVRFMDYFYKYELVNCSIFHTFKVDITVFQNNLKNLYSNSRMLLICLRLYLIHLKHYIIPETIIYTLYASFNSYN